MSVSDTAGSRSPAPRARGAAGREPERRRRADSIANDARILDAALAYVIEGGVDRLSMRDVARRAGMRSASGLYARYENTAELAVALWGTRCSDAVRRFLAIAMSNCATEDQELVMALVAAVQSPSDELAAGVELMAVARRIDELGEVIAPDVDSWLDQGGAGPNATAQERAVRMGSAVFALGMVMSERPAEVPRTDWTFHVRWQAGILLEPSRYRGRVTALPQPETHLDIDDPVRSSLVAATAAIVARSGYERATAQRVARRAGYSTGAIYARYHDRDALMADAVQQILTATFRAGMDRNGELIRAGTFVDSSAGIMAGHVGPQARAVGRLMLEMHISAAHRPIVGSALAKAHRETLPADLAQLGQTDERFAVLPRGTRAMRLGLYLLDDLLAEHGGLTDIDWRPFIIPQAKRALTDPALWSPTGSRPHTS